MTAAQENKTTCVVPDSLFDPHQGRTYTRGRFFGKGGFASCYEIIDVHTDDVFACKIVSKKLMMKPSQEEETADPEKIAEEISIHRGLNHPSIVKFFSSFDDIDNTYIVLELCRMRSMSELKRRRKIITEFECRYYITQIIEGVQYLHDNRIIHRDLKLANLFLNDMLHVKIGDFGLATRIELEGDRRYSVCGSPNYIAPEILTKKGHSFEADIWSIGCIMYKLLAGRPPFHHKTREGVFSNIKKCQYSVPSWLTISAADMIVSMLQLDPERRPAIGQLLNCNFLKAAKVPQFLPSFCLTMAPHIGIGMGISDPVKESIQRRPLMVLNGLRDDNRNDASVQALAQAQVCRYNDSVETLTENQGNGNTGQESVSNNTLCPRKT
ncbi:serine/threonine-protein kinase polo-like [Drosophila miranda]|uniref:serine/threonine-protein kinase polo-like n=1 Tax=Drosophila miranda TaxID=7229 RepID=UPI0007E87CD5|nr:serine/threonine-protein kinase polo-like [Drosophila miranda]